MKGTAPTCAAILACILSACAFAGSAHGQALRMGRPVDVPGAGLRFSPFEQIPQLPLPSPRAMVWEEHDSGARHEIFDVADLWRFRQTHALFTNELGRIRVVELAMHLPVDEPELVQGQYVTSSDFEALRSRAAPEWDAERFRQWMEDYTGHEVIGFSSLPSHLAIPFPCREFRFATETGRAHAFLLRMQDARSARFVAFVFEWSDPQRVPNLEASVHRLLRGVTRSAIQADFERGEDLRRRRAPVLGAQGGATPEFEAARRRTIEQIRAMPDWWYVEMPPYILVSDLPRARRTLVDRIQRDIPILRTAFMQLFPPVGPQREVSLIRVFDGRQAYENYVGEHSAWTLGVWMPSRRELVVASVTSSGRGQRTSEILNTAYHEAFHQYVFYALNETELPRWLDEGHAVLFESITLNAARGSVVVNENESRIQSLEYAIDTGRRIDLVQLMYKNYDDFYVTATPDARWERNFNYSSAWAFVYFLRKGVPVLHRDKGYDQLIPTIVEHLLENPRDFDGAHQAALRRVDRQALQRDFDDFWRNRSARAAARRHRLFD